MFARLINRLLGKFAPPFERFQDWLSERQRSATSHRVRLGVELIEDRIVPTPVITIAALSAGSENDTELIYRLTRTETSGPLEVFVNVGSGTATSDIDYITPEQSVTFANGKSTVDLAVVVLDDDLWEPPNLSEPTETVVATLQLSGMEDYTLGSPSSAIGSILDNDTPVAVDDDFGGDEDDTVTGNVLTNDTDPNASSLTASVVDEPVFGSVDLSSNGAFEYTPAPDFFGTDVFTYQVSDGGSGHTTALVTITLDPDDADDPVIENQEFTIDENMPDDSIVGVVAASDPDWGQTLTYSITAGNGSGAFAINAVTGMITVATAAVLNYEVTTQFVLTIQVTDNATFPQSQTATVDLNLTDLAEDAETEAERVEYLNGKYDDFQNVLDDLDPGTSEAVAEVFGELGAMITAADGLVASQNNPTAFAKYAADYAIAMDNLGADIGWDVYVSAGEALGLGMEMAAKSEGDVLRIAGIEGLLGEAGDELLTIQSAVNATHDATDKAISTLTDNKHGVPWVLGSGELDLEIDSITIDAILTAFTTFAANAPGPDENDPDTTDESLSAPYVPQFNPIAANVAYDFTILELQLEDAFGITNYLYARGLEMEEYQDDATGHNRTAYNTALTAYLGANGLAGLSGSVSPYDDDYPHRASTGAHPYDNYGAIGAIFDMADAFLDDIDEAKTKLDSFDDELELVDQLRSKGIDSYLAPLEGALTNLDTAVGGLLDQMTALVNAMQPATLSVMFPEEEDLYCFALYPFIANGEDEFYGISDYISEITGRRGALP